MGGRGKKAGVTAAQTAAPTAAAPAHVPDQISMEEANKIRSETTSLLAPDWEKLSIGEPVVNLLTGKVYRVTNRDLDLAEVATGHKLSRYNPLWWQPLNPALRKMSAPRTEPARRRRRRRR